MACLRRAVCQNGGLVSSEILFNFASAWLVRAAMKAATSASRWNVKRKRGRQCIKTFDSHLRQRFEIGKTLAKPLERENNKFIVH